MNLLTIRDLSKQYSERLLFDGANLLINEGDRIGLIGVNGSGKSTLLRIAAGLESPDAGSVILWGGVRVEYLPQEPELDDDQGVLETIFRSDSAQMVLLRRYEQAVHALEQNAADPHLMQRVADLSAELERTNGWAAEANAKAILTRLGIVEFGRTVGQLSGGQRKRVALARALIDRADLLILDEPTNHIDADTVSWLESYLAGTPGALLMVTHDRYFLDRVVNQIVELDRRRLVVFSGNYSAYLEQRQDRHQRLAEAERKRQKLLRRELEWLRRAPMARGTKQKARRQRVHELMGIQYDSGDEQVVMALSGKRLGKQVLTAQGLTKQYDRTTVLDDVSLTLAPGDRIGIVGANGSGKSTLLEILAGRIQADTGCVQWGETVQLGYYDQRSVALDDNLRLIEFIEREAPLIRTADGERVEAAKMLEWFLFPRSMQYGRIGSLSGGERRRLYMLRTLVHQPNVLFLDEPTNDLDIQTLAVLEEFLDHFRGALVVVTHDRYFLDRTVDYIHEMQHGRLGPRLPSPYSTFLTLRTADDGGGNKNGKDAGAPRAAASTAPVADGAARKLSWKERQELRELEESIEQMESERSTLIAAMAAASGDYVRLTDLAATQEQLDTELEARMERWLELQERSDHA